MFWSGNTSPENEIYILVLEPSSVLSLFPAGGSDQCSLLISPLQNFVLELILIYLLVWCLVKWLLYHSASDLVITCKTSSMNPFLSATSISVYSLLVILFFFYFSLLNWTNISRARLIQVLKRNLVILSYYIESE